MNDRNREREKRRVADQVEYELSLERAKEVAVDQRSPTLVLPPPPPDGGGVATRGCWR